MLEENVRNIFYKNESKYSIKNEEDYYNSEGGSRAINSAFKDFSSRTLKKLKTDAEIDGNKRKDALEKLKKEFFNYFNETEKKKKEFDEWHAKICNEFITNYNVALGKDYEHIKFGKAQKIVNMTFKYLYCYNNVEEKYFQYCHMPLDSYTLNWYKKNVAEPKIKISNWSNLEQDEYNRIQCEVRKYLQENRMIKIDNKDVPLPHSPFEAEFYIWEQEVKKGNFEELMKAINTVSEDYLSQIPSGWARDIKVNRREKIEYDCIAEKLELLKESIERFK